MEARIITCQDIMFAKEYILTKIESKLTKLYECDEFKVDDAKAVMKEAYIAEEKVKHLIIVATTYRIEAQNALLKLLEEPPRNIELIIITESKSTLLPTVRSRLKIISETKAVAHKELDLKLANLDLRTLFDFVKAHERLSKHEAKNLIESIYHRATVIDRLPLSEKQILVFERSYKLLELNARLQSVLVTLLMGFLKGRRGR